MGEVGGLFEVSRGKNFYYLKGNSSQEIDFSGEVVSSEFTFSTLLRRVISKPIKS